MGPARAGAHRLTTRFGPDAPGLLPIYGQLALLKFVEGDYEGALHAAQRCYAAAVQREGEGSRGTLPHAVRYGVMLLGGRPFHPTRPGFVCNGIQGRSLSEG